MGSSRLPGKTLKEISKKPMIWYVVNRLNLIKGCKLVIITSDHSRDDQLVSWCKKNKIEYFRGSEMNVLERYFSAAKKYNAKNIIRATGDNPLVEPRFAENLLKKHIQYNADYSSNKSEIGSNLPDGLGVEIFTFKALNESYNLSSLPHHFEHVNEYILENKKNFRIYKDSNASGLADMSSVRLTVDTEEDFSKIQTIFSDERFSIDINYPKLLEIVDEYIN